MKKEILEFRKTAVGLSTSHTMTKKEFDSIEKWLFETFREFDIAVTTLSIKVRIPLSPLNTRKVN